MDGWIRRSSLYDIRLLYHVLTPVVDDEMLGRGDGEAEVACSEVRGMFGGHGARTARQQRIPRAGINHFRAYCW